jgi:hypothetical protein
MPTRSGAMPHSDACERITRIACCPSAISSGITVFLRSAITAGSLSMLSPLRMSRYFNTNAATPMEFSQRAQSVPSKSIMSRRNPPPGQMIIAVPVAMDRSGKKAVSVGWVTLKAARGTVGDAAVSFSSQFQLSDPGAAPGQRGIIFGSAAKMATAKRKQKRRLMIASRLSGRAFTSLTGQRRACEKAAITVSRPPS